MGRTTIRTISLPINPYGKTLHLYFSPKSLLNVLTKEGIPMPSEGLTPEGDILYGITIPHNNKVFVGVFDNSLDTLVHELSHVCLLTLCGNNTLTDIDDSGQQEAFAHLMGWLVEEVMRKINKTKQPITLFPKEN